MNLTTHGATQDEVRRHNLGQLLSLLHVNGPMPRAELTKRTGLNRSTVGALTTDLAGVGLIREEAPVGRGVGRPSIVAAPNGNEVFVLAFDVRVERTVAAVVGLGGVVIARREVVHSRRATGPDAVLNRAETLGRECLGEMGPGAVCVGIGVAVPGVVRHEDGLVRFAPNMGWLDIPLAARLGEALRTTLPVSVGNDADLGALAEHVRGAAAGRANVIFLSGDVGVGGGIILGGRPMVGAGGYGGEVGHMVVNPGGRACRCGRKGCWETEIGEDAVLRALGVSQRADVEDLLGSLAAHPNGGPPALRKVGRWMGIGIVNLVNIFNPEVVVFGDLLRQLLPLVEGQIREQFKTALAAPREQVMLALPALGRDSALLGAAETVFGQLLDDPLTGVAKARAASFA